MTNPPKIRMNTSPVTPRQMSIAFESSKLFGLTAAERMKALTHLAYLLMLAVGVAAEENGDDR
jgi:hypothetical protein